MIIRRTREVPDIVLIITPSYELGFRRFNSLRVQNEKIYNHAKDVTVTASHAISGAISTPQVPPSFKETTPPVTHLEEVDETIGILTEVEPLDHMKLEDLGLNTDTHDHFLSSKGFPSVDEPET
ncbi:hypothetical protein Tco_0154753 [Tanacetum coccineum]